MMPRKSNASARFWKWRSRSTKSASESDARDLFTSTTQSSMISPSLGSEAPVSVPMSPFLSESAHVLSLQHPLAVSPTSRMSEVMVSSDSNNADTSNSSVAKTEEPHRTSLESARSLVSSLRHRSFLVKAKQGIEARLRPMIRKDVRNVFPSLWISS